MTFQILAQKPTAQQIEISAAMDDLIENGDDPAAALALGDLWLTLSPADRAAVVGFLKELTEVDPEPESASQRMFMVLQNTLIDMFRG